MRVAFLDTARVRTPYAYTQFAIARPGPADRIKSTRSHFTPVAATKVAVRKRERARRELHLVVALIRDITTGASLNDFIFPRAQDGRITVALSFSFFLSLHLSSILAREFERCNGRYLVVARCILGGIDGRRGRERERERKREGGEERWESTWRPVFWKVHRQPPSLSVFSSPLRASSSRTSLPLSPSRSLIFERKRKMLEIARENDESITVALKLYNFNVDFDYVILINFITSFDLNKNYSSLSLPDPSL